MARWPAASSYPATPKAYPASPKAYPGAALAAYPASAPDASDLRNQPHAAQLAASYTIDSGITLSAVPFTSGSGTPPVGAFSGNLAQTAAFRMEVTTGGALGAAAARISQRSGFDYYNEYEGDLFNGVLTGAPIALGNGLIYTPAAGAYQTDHLILGKVASWAPKWGNLANCVLDDATLSTVGPIIEATSGPAFGYSLYFNGMGLANQGGLPAVANGLNLSMHVMACIQIHTLAAPSGALVPWGFFNQAAGSNSKNILDIYYSGSSATPANAWGFQRRDNTPNTTKTCQSSAVPDLSWHLQNWNFDNATGLASFFRANIADGAAQNIATAASVVSDRFTLGFSKTGTTAATNFALFRLTELDIWQASFSDTDRTSIVLARA